MLTEAIEIIRARDLPEQGVESVRPYWEAGFTDIALVQVGGEAQHAFLDEAAGPLLEKLGAASKKA